MSSQLKLLKNRTMKFNYLTYQNYLMSDNMQLITINNQRYSADLIVIIEVKRSDHLCTWMSMIGADARQEPFR